MLQAGIKSNSVPETATLTCDVRSLPWQDEKYVRGQVEKVLEGIPGIEVEIDYTAISNASPYEAPFVAVTQEALRTALGGREYRPLPMLTGGFTDSRFMRELGIQVYDFWPSHPDAETMNTGIHGANEFVEVETLVFQTKYLLALARLALA
jgi:acetylornithine deacetylase/succinyl-diaminopimelate desuccinylase-like protein